MKPLHLFLIFYLILTKSRLSRSHVMSCDLNQQEQSQRIEEHLDTTAEACEDFYEYSCGNWRVPYKLRSLNAQDALTALKADNKRILMQYLEQDEFIKTEKKSEKLDQMQLNVINFYNSCINTRLNTNSYDNGIHIYIDELKKLGTWPILEAVLDSDYTCFEWQQISAALRRYGVHTLWRLLVRPNWQAAEQPMYYIMAPSFDFLKRNKHADTYDENSVFLYERYVKYLMLDLGVRVRKAKEIAKITVNFEKQLMNLFKNEQTTVLLKEPQTLSSISRDLPYLQLETYFNTLLQQFKLSNSTINNLFIVADVTYLQKLNDFIETTTDESISTYFLVQFLAHFEIHLHVDDTFIEQKQYCLQQVNKYMPLQLSAVFLELLHGNVVDYVQNTQTHLTNLFEKLKLQFEHMLNGTHVFERDTNTRTLVLDKLHAMRLQLPNLEQYNQTAYNFEINENYDLNLLNLSKQRAHQELAIVVNSLDIDTNRDKTDSSNTNNGNGNSNGNSQILMESNACGPLDVNAYYRVKRNVIEIPFGILRPPFYDKCLASPQIYGSFIYILAHELLHGFDYDGLNYDKTGNVTNNWGAKSIIDYGTKAKCYLSPRYRNATLTINENIADSEGLRLALDTYVMAGDGSSQLKQEDLRMFFISFAQTWCGRTTLTTNSFHSSHSDRVNNVVANFEEFAQVFKCSASSALNPEEKCKIW